jgi:hypothetical protein
MRIGILTGGGDVPGLNPCIKAVVNRVAQEGHEVVGLRRGWGALVHHVPGDPESAARWFQELTPQNVRTVDRTGGTFLHTSRTNPSRVRLQDVPAHLADRAQGEGPFDFTDHALKVVESLGIDVLIPIGGDDTLSYGLRMHQEGVPVIAIPKTMDNDVHGTDYCIGFSTAITRGVQFIHNLLIHQPSVFTRDGWAARLPVAEPGAPPFGTGLTREQIARVRLPMADLLEYATAVGEAIQAYADTLDEEEGAEEVALPFFTPVYPMIDRVSKAEVLTFFCIGHTAEHLGEVQYIKGLLGLTGAPL